MDTQNTPIHIHLWHKDFWFLAMANMLLTIAVYMLIPVQPLWLLKVMHLTQLQVGLIMGSYGIGLFLFGPFVSYLVQKYRRNAVCVNALCAMAILVWGMYYIQGRVSLDKLCAWHFVAWRVLLGACFGLAHMVLTSTLIIDKSESFQRTEANHSASWFGRFGISIGPMVGLLIVQYAPLRQWGTMDCLAALICIVIAYVLIRGVSFPFRAHEDYLPKVSLDRFFLPRGKWLFLNLMMVTTILGLVMSMAHTPKFYAMMMAGFLLAIMAEKYAFADANLKSETITGLLLMGTAFLIMLTRRQVTVEYIAPFFIGFGIGIIGSRFLLFFLKLSRHCQRGTSQSTFFLAWESGISLGLFLGYAVFCQRTHELLWCGLALTIVALLFYNFFTHGWYVKHKNR